MPLRPNTPCRHPGCAALVPYGTKYCDVHKPMHPEEVRSAESRGYGSGRQKARKQYLEVTMTDLDGKHPQEITAMVYLMADGHPLQEPLKGYLDTLAEGYYRFGFNPYQLDLALMEAKEVS